MIRLCGIHFTVIPASFDRLRSRNPEPAPAEAGGERRAVALDPRLRGGDDRVCSTCSESALVPEAVEITDRPSSSGAPQPSGAERSGAGMAERTAGARG